jgi:hypothetical protein
MTLEEDDMVEEIELPGGVKVVRTQTPPAATQEAAAVGHDPGIAPREPSAEETRKGALS